MQLCNNYITVRDSYIIVIYKLSFSEEAGAGGGSAKAAVGERTGYDPYITIMYRFIGLIYTLI